MSTDTNPPVGATVVDAEGDQYTCWQHYPRAVFGPWVEWVNSSWGACETSHNATLTAIWRMQQRAEQAEAELAKHRALAVEAKEMVDDGTPSQAGLLRYETGDLHRFIEHLAALATPNQEPPR